MASDTTLDKDESVVLVELSGVIDNDFLQDRDKNCKILGVNSSNPIMQINHYMFTGEYKNALGSLVLFEESEGSKKNDDKKELKMRYITDKKLIMKRIFLKENKTQKGCEEKMEVDTTNNDAS